MARKLRLQYPGAIYHLINRGDHREPVFLEDADRALFLSTLGEACSKTDWQVHAYCLMNNHFQLVLETPKANLAEGMKWLFADSAAGRREFARRMEVNRRVEVTGEYQKIRRGWCYGEDAFRRELLLQASQQMGQHHYGEERKESAEDKATRVMAAGLKEAGWQESDLASRRKGDPVKIALARRLRQETTMPLKWICERLQMGSWKSVNRRLYEHRQSKC